MATKASDWRPPAAVCRCCFTEGCYKDISTEYFWMGKREVYEEILLETFNVNISYAQKSGPNSNSRLICEPCISRLHDAADFKKQVVECERVFQQYLSKLESGIVKVEIEAGLPDKEEVKVERVKIERKADDDDDDGGDGDFGVGFPDDDDDDLDDQPLTTFASKVPKNETVHLLEVLESAKTEKRKSSTKVKVTPAKAKKKAGKPRPAPVEKKKVSQMAKKQEIIRERDKVLTNTSIVVEYSFACPFKCRHNHLICYYCGETYLDPGQLRKHTEEKHHPKNFSITETRKSLTKIDLHRIDCRLCPAKIDSLEDFKRHIIQVHKKKYYLESKDSILPFKLVINEWACALCSVSFPYFHALNRHMNQHFSNCVCEICGQGFVDGRRYLMHKHRHKEGNYPCPDCGKIFRQDYKRELHIDSVHKKKGRIYCPQCHKVFMSYQTKRKHLVEEHGEESLALPCSVCKEVFPSRRHLTLHQRKVHLKDYRHECQYCGQKFFTRSALTSHMPTHTGERNYKCKVCEKTYPRPKTLREHMRIHNNDRRYRCDICGQAFVQNCSLKGHMKSKHPECE